MFDPNSPTAPQPGYDDQQPAQTSSSAPVIWLIVSICVTLFCCLPLGIVGIIFSALAMGAQNQGDHAKAAANVKTAMICDIIGIVVGIVLIILWIVFTFVVAAGAAGAAEYSTNFIL